jgi:hypothetical protein
MTRETDRIAVGQQPIDAAASQGAQAATDAGLGSSRLEACHCFKVTAVAGADTAVRVLALFAQRSLLPTRVTISLDGNEALTLTIDQPGLDQASALRLAAKAKALVVTHSVELFTAN